MFCFFFVKQKTAYEMRIRDWSSDVCSSDLENSEQRLGMGRKVGCLLERMLDGAHLRQGELRLLVDPHLGDRLVARALLMHRHGEHERPIGRLDPVALLP